MNNIFLKNNYYKYKNYFNIPMMPYPSGNLHIGHIRNYCINDINNRFLKLKKYNTYNFIGWDCFGTPAENISLLKNKIPSKWIKNNIKYMKKQLKVAGFFNKWNKLLETFNKKYYKITQWIFIKLLKNNLIYFNNKKINWDPVDNTVLSNEQVINGLSWRSGVKIKLIKKRTYFINLLKYKRELLNELKNLNWPKKVKLMQFNWLGFLKKKYFKLFFFKLNIFKYILIKKIYTIFNIILLFFIKKTYNESKKKYINSGLFIINLKNSKKIELWIIYNLKKNINTNLIINKNIYNIFIFCNLNFIDYKFLFKKKYFNLLKEKKNWNIKDWGISRQRYWGTPIPINKCKNCGYIINKNNYLLPNNLKSKYKYNILDKNIYYIYNFCSKCKNISYKESDTLDTFFDSSWYFLNYLKFKKKKNKVNLWMPIDFYSGGIEHSILHLLYSRFIIKFLRDIKHLNFGEPIKYLFTQGMILNKTYYNKKNGIINWISSKDSKKVFSLKGKIQKMSKSKKNGINPNKLIKIYGVDSLRLSVIYSSSLNKDFLWKKKYIKNCHKFLKKFLYFYKKNKKYIKKKYFYKKNTININDKKFLYFFYKKIENINFFYLNIKYNKIVSIFCILFKKIKNYKFNWFIINEVFSSIIRIIYPIIPHISLKIWNDLYYNNKLGDLLYTFWPKIYLLKVNNNKKYLLFVNNKKIDILNSIKNKFLKKIINYLFFKKKIKKKYIKKIIINKNIINIILKTK